MDQVNLQALRDRSMVMIEKLLTSFSVSSGTLIPGACYLLASEIIVHGSDPNAHHARQAVSQ